MPTLTIADIQARATKLREKQSERDSMYADLENMFLVQDTSLPQGDHIKETLSPDARNAVQGAVRLLAGTFPKWHVPDESNTGDVDEISSKLERLAAQMWAGSCRVQRKLVHKELVLSAVLYGEVHLAVKSTKAIKEAASNNNQKRAEAALLRTPVLFEALPARYCYAEFDALGLSGHYLFKKATVGNVIAVYGKDAETALAGRRADEEIELSEWWDEANHAVWIGSAGAQVVLEDNPYNAIPIAAAICEGSDLFLEQGQQTRQPLLYTSWKTNAWQRKNLALTIASSVTFAVGANPMLVFKSSSDEPLNIDYSQPGGVAQIKANEDLQPLQKQVIDPSLMTLLEQMTQLDEESTIYRQALGQPLGANAPFSMVALLSQAGRLPLVIYQRVLSFALGDAMQIALDIVREDGAGKLRDSKGTIEIKQTEIPEDVEIECELEIDAPQDERQNAMLATQLAGGEDPILSRETAAKRFLQVDQYDEEMKRIYFEKRDRFNLEQKFQMEAAQAQMKMQQQMQQMQMQQQQAAMQPPAMPPNGMQGPGPGPAPGGDPFGDFAAQMGGAPGAGLPADAMTQPGPMPGEEMMPGEEEMI